MMAVDGVAVDMVMALVAGAEVGGNFVVDRFWFYRFLVLGATVFGSSKTKRVLPIGLGARALAPRVERVNGPVGEPKSPTKILLTPQSW